ncbi:MAG: hypothetical protein ACOX5R_06660 [bacterium]
MENHPNLFHIASRETEELSGPVKETRIETIRASDEDSSRKAVTNKFRTIMRFDRHGLKTEELNYNPDGTLSNREVFSFDTHGRLIKKISTTETDIPRLIWTYTYSNNGREITEICKSGESLESREVIYLDDSGRKVEEFSYDRDEELVQISRYEYVLENGKQKMIWKALTPGEDLLKKRIYAYSDQKLIIQKEILTYSDELEAREIYEYDDNNNLIEAIYYQGTHLIYQYSYQYRLDKQGNWVERKATVRYPENGITSEYISERVVREIDYYS